MLTSAPEVYTMKKFLLFTSIALLASSCAEEQQPGTYRNENIDPEVIEAIEALDAELIGHLKNKREKELKAMMSEDLIASLDESIVPFLELTERTLQSSDYDLVDHYHRIGNPEGEHVALISGSELDDDYIIQYQSLQASSFVSVMAPKRDGDRFLLTTFYGLTSDGWKLNMLQFDRYTISGRSALDLYKEAKDAYAKGHLINAINRMVLAQSCMHPAGEYWQFRLEQEMDQFAAQLSAEAQETYPMPFELKDVLTKPVVFQITPQRVDQQICTMIKYKTDINIKDTTALAAENKSVHELSSTLFPGIDTDVSFIFYRAFNEFPKEEASTPYFGFVRPLDERLL
jgi:hypothetical protein